MGGGKSSSSSTQQTTNQDNRVVADSGALAVGAGANVNYSYVQGLDENVNKLITNVLSVVSDVATGAGSAVSKALDTTTAVAERNQVTGAGNALVDALSSPSVIILGAIVALVLIRKL